MARSRCDRPGAGNALDSVDEAQEFHGRNDPEPCADLEQLGKPIDGTVQVNDLHGRAGDDVRASQLDRLGHPPPAVVEDALVLGSFRRDPPMERDHAHNLQASVGNRPFQIGELAPLLEVSRDLVVPGLDRGIAGFAGDRDLLQQGVGRIVLVLRQ